MKTEFEVKFLSIDIARIREKLQAGGGQLLQPMRLMKRVIIETEDLRKKDAFLRVRDEGDKVTLTYKQFKSLSVDGAKEYEIVVSNFATMLDIFEAVGLKYKSLQESRRETWQYGEAEVVIDEWPWLKPYIEIESESEARVRGAAERLGFAWNEAVFGDVMAAYRKQYPRLTETDTVANLPEVKFDTPLPPMLTGKI